MKPAILFSFTIFVSAFLLFFVQPLAGRMLLPTFGGSAIVWNASMMFFQALLLLGYIYAHFSIKRLGAKNQSKLHIALMIAAAVFLPLSITPEAPQWDASPALFVIQTLLVSIGLPFFVLSASAPMLQSWYFSSDAPDADDPYWLYVASNIGSLLALLTYPFLIEPFLSITEQKWVWTGGYALLVLSVFGASFFVKKAPAQETTPTATTSSSWSERGLWTLLAFIPSSALLGYTAHITTDISAIPLFWVVPLALYMLSFVIVFARRQWIPSSVWIWLAFAALVPSAYAILLALLEPVGLLLGIQLFSLFTLSVAFHAMLVDRKPKASNLTDFYVWMSVGGMLGGVFNTLVAPAIFDRMYELPITLALAFLLLSMHLPRPKFEPPSVSIGKAVHAKGMQTAFGVLVLATASVGFVTYMQSVDEVFEFTNTMLLIGILTPFALWFVHPILAGFAAATVCMVLPMGYQHQNILMQKRSPYAIHEVREFSSSVGQFHSLYHGRIQHGVQATHPELSRLPLSYYHTSSPIGEVMAIREDFYDVTPVAVLGLGIGTMATYVRPGMEMTFFEIDPQIEKIARDAEYFTYLERCGDQCKVVLGDARLSLQEQPKGKYGLLVLDAYSSDAVPVHLLSKEAIELYMSLLRPGGYMLFHVSNRYVNVRQIVVNTAAELGYVSYFQDHWPRETKLEELMVNSSEWVMVGRDKKDLELQIFDPRWEEQEADGRPAWTDDWANLWVYMAW